MNVSFFNKVESKIQQKPHYHLYLNKRLLVDRIKKLNDSTLLILIN